MFDIKKPYGQCIGGALDGCVVQDNKFYRRDGVEVGSDGKPLQPDKVNGKSKKTPTAKPAEAPAVDPQVAEQLKAE